MILALLLIAVAGCHSLSHVSYRNLGAIGFIIISIIDGTPLGK